MGWDLMVDNVQIQKRVRGWVKWFDSGKGFGFIVSSEGGPDILLHVNALRNFGISSICEKTGIEVSVQRTDRGLQAVEVFEISPVEERLEADSPPTPVQFPEEVLSLALEAARIKWFDKGKGFGFANVFGRPEDVFVHMDVLRRSGFADLQAGEAVCLRIQDGERGRMAVMVAPWDAGLRETALRNAS